jgi:hypothetical protein
MAMLPKHVVLEPHSLGDKINLKNNNKKKRKAEACERVNFVLHLEFLISDWC